MVWAKGGITRDEKLITIMKLRVGCPVIGAERGRRKKVTGMEEMSYAHGKKGKPTRKKKSIWCGKKNGSRYSLLAESFENGAFKAKREKDRGGEVGRGRVNSAIEQQGVVSESAEGEQRLEKFLKKRRVGGSRKPEVRQKKRWSSRRAVRERDRHVYTG